MRRTIISYLLSNSPNGIKKIWVENQNCNCIYLTRGDLNFAKDRKELNSPALYFLFGESESEYNRDKKVYIGETENFNKRIPQHKKEFWNEILVFTARDNFLSKAEVKYLECLAIGKTKELQNYSLEGNKQNPNFPTLEEHRIETINGFFGEIIFLSSFLNFNLFKEYEKKIEKNKEESEEEKTIWHCESKGVTAKGVYDGKNFVVLAGSAIVKKHKSSLNKKSLVKLREIIIENSKNIDKGEYLELEKILNLLVVVMQQVFV